MDKEEKENIMKHKESGRQCMVAHYDDQGHLESACIKCAICFKWIRPNDMEKECIPLIKPVNPTREARAGYHCVKCFGI